MCANANGKRKLLMAEVNRTVCDIIYLINDFVGDNMILEDIGRAWGKSGYYALL